MHRGLTGCVMFVIAPVISAVAVVIGIAIVNNIDMEGSTRAAWIFGFFLFFSLVAQALALGFGSLAAWLLIGIYSVVGFVFGGLGIAYFLCRNMPTMAEYKAQESVLLREWVTEYLDIMFISKLGITADSGFLAVNMVVGIFLPVFIVGNIIIGIPLMILGIFIKRE